MIPIATSTASTTAAAITSARGKRIPNRRSSEKRPGPVSVRANAEAILVRGNSAPPLLAQIGLPQWALAVAMTIAPIVPMGPSGCKKPNVVSTPPPNSEAEAAVAQVVPGLSPIDSKMAAVPFKPDPPNQPENFCAPWPASSPPVVSRKTRSPVSRIVLSLFRLLRTTAFLRAAGIFCFSITASFIVSTPSMLLQHDDASLTSINACRSLYWYRCLQERLIEDASTTVLPGRHWIVTLYTLMKVEVLQGIIDLTIPLSQCIVTTIVVTMRRQP